VIPAFNCVSTIEAAVQSCLDQTYDPVEIIVVNDGSTDGTRDALECFGRRIHIIDQANGGLAAARNAGQRAARGEFVAWMDGDDLARPERLQAQVAALRAVPQAELVCSDFSAFLDPTEDFDLSHIRTYYATLRRLGGIATVFPNKKSIKVEGTGDSVTVRWSNVYDALLAGNFVHPPTVLASRRLLERAGEFDPTLRYSSDYDFLLRASRVAQFAYIDVSLLRYRRSAGQLSRAAGSGKLQLETVRILEKARREDATLDARRGDDLRRFSAEALLQAAQALARSDRIEGLRLVRAARSHYFLPMASLRTLARLVVPNSAVDAVKRLRGRLIEAAASLVFCETFEIDGLFAFAQLALPSLVA